MADSHKSSSESTRSASWFHRNPVVTLVSVTVIGLGCIDLALGSVFSLPRPQTLDTNYHHGLLSMIEGSSLSWGETTVGLSTNSLGFVDAMPRHVPLTTQRHRLLFMGDSFTQGIGVPYEKSFVGTISAELSRHDIEVLNAGVVGYSPKLHFLKAKHFVETVGIKIDEIVVYVDTSDAQDEIVYRNFVAGSMAPSALARRLYAFMLRHSYVLPRTEFLSYALVMAFRRSLHRISSIRSETDTAHAETLYDSEKALSQRDSWIFDVDAFDAWGRVGLDLAAENIDRLAELCQRHGIALSLDLLQK